MALMQTPPSLLVQQLRWKRTTQLYLHRQLLLQLLQLFRVPSLRLLARHQCIGY